MLSQFYRQLISRYYVCCWISTLFPHTFRNNIREHFMSCISSTMELFNETTNLLLSKSLEVRSPYIPYLQKVDMVEKQRFLAG